MSIPETVKTGFEQTIKAIRDPLMNIALVEVGMEELEENGNPRGSAYAICVVHKREEDVEVTPIALLPYYVDDENNVTNFDLHVAGEDIEAFKHGAGSIPEDALQVFEPPEDLVCSADDFDEGFDDEDD